MGTIAVAWWNLENLFDTDDDPIPQDFESTRANGCTDEVYAAKRANLAAVLNQLHDGNGPELLGVAEVERVGASPSPSGNSSVERDHLASSLVGGRAPVEQG